MALAAEHFDTASLVFRKWKQTGSQINRRFKIMCGPLLASEFQLVMFLVLKHSF